LRSVFLFVVFHGRFIPTVNAASHVVELKEVLDITAQIIHTDNNLPNLLVSDASETSAFVFLANGSFAYVADFPFSTDQAMASSTLRELLALSQALSQDGPKFLSSGIRFLYWQTDNKACTWIVPNGSRNPVIQRVVFTIKCKERDFSLRVIPVWTPRIQTRILLADAGSRFSRSTDEWSIDRHDLATIFAHFSFQPDTDCYASSKNAVCPHFYSKVPQLACAGVDFLAQKPTTTNLFLCPPVSGILAAFNHALTLRSKNILLLLPDWPSTVFWSTLHPAGLLHPAVTRSHVFHPTFFSVVSVPSLFTSGARIPILALQIQTN
jgi:hypothetical protein